MILSKSQIYPGTYLIEGHLTEAPEDNYRAEFSNNGTIKIQIWNADFYFLKDYINEHELDLLYTEVRSGIWMPLFFNGRLLNVDTKTQRY